MSATSGRKQDDYLGGLDELPSGHVEQGERALTALRREVKEEFATAYS